MLVGEAPGYHEDRQGLPFVGRAGDLLEKLLERIGYTRDDVFIANVLKCRPPENRDPQPEEIELCRPFLRQQIEIIQPAIVCTMGNFATRLLTGKSDGISSVHGRPLPFPDSDDIRIFPVFHPAAALYTWSNLALLEKDFDVMAGLISAPDKHQPEVEASATKPEPQVEATNGEAEPEQLGLF